jgi:AraC-like DNA-binding protein
MDCLETPPIKGLQIPGGRLLSRIVDIRSKYGMAYERSIGYQKDVHFHDRATLSIPRGSSIIEFADENFRNRLAVDNSTFHWMPKDMIHGQTVKTVIYDNLAFFPADSVLSALTINLSKKALSALDRTQIAKKSALMDELSCRYLYKRLNDEVDHLIYHQILEEAVRILVGQNEDAHSEATLEPTETGTLRAIEFIEANLFSKFSVVDVAKYSRVSVPTLFRLFRRETNLRPFEYIWGRRLDEAKALLMTKEYNVGDVAVLVGYEEVSGFSKAFKKRFNREPSHFKM